MKAHDKKPSLYPDDHRCFLCGSPYVELHHILPSSRRPISDREGLTVFLCHEHHQGRSGVHQDRALDLSLRRDAQRRWEEREGIDDLGHSEFINVFYESYL